MQVEYKYKISRFKTTFNPKRWGENNVIYCIKNMAHGKQYIGQTTQKLRRRFHRYLSGQATIFQSIAKSINHYGPGEFEVSILYACRDKNRSDRISKKLNKITGFTANS